ncbi:MAG: hypothetical protein LW710_13105 [Burkholderiales bacterium]|jgi:hypothetical protein|uniref:hypothetical protein n=1 Tax=Limnobacter sp. TaxID=2003368 RepID=UPI0039BCD858|nr:hypothetical protein [Burkholderiales bacterium]
MCALFQLQRGFIVHKLVFALAGLASVVSLAGCASTHDLTKGNNMMGGGYKQEELGPGLFYIYARSNHAPWANMEAARATWRTGAERACGSAEYDELFIKETERDTGLQNSSGVRYLVTERTAYAKCDSSSLSKEEIKKLIERNAAGK